MFKWFWTIFSLGAPESCIQVFKYTKESIIHNIPVNEKYDS